MSLRSLDCSCLACSPGFWLSPALLHSADPQHQNIDLTQIFVADGVRKFIVANPRLFRQHQAPDETA